MANPNTQYAISASKGFSYYLPKPAQQHLQSLIKQLPSPARPIYTEYYRDLMCAKAPLLDSADHSTRDLGGDLQATQVTKPTDSNPTTTTPLPEKLPVILNPLNVETSHHTGNTLEVTDHHNMVPSVVHSPSTNTSETTDQDNAVSPPAHARSAEKSGNVNAENQDIDMQEPTTAAIEKDDDVDMLISEEQGWEEGVAAIEGFSWK
ncbi:hypothetical protein N0V94_004158 [Neodidymelliopsis sp. IMI 364377]|nr:hypothetical protein N0V94_004158 [Neodidymelliopsis sp. IMI 364377]